MRVAVASVDTESRTTEIVVVAGTDEVRCGRVLVVISSDILTRRQTTMGRLTIALTVNRITGTVARVVIALTAGVVSAKVSARTGVVDR